MHFSWDISAGQIIVTFPLLWIIGQITKAMQLLLRVRVEHEILMSDWANRQTPPVRLQDLPTRQAKWW